MTVTIPDRNISQIVIALQPRGRFAAEGLVEAFAPLSPGHFQFVVARISSKGHQLRLIADLFDRVSLLNRHGQVPDRLFAVAELGILDRDAALDPSAS